MRTVKIQTILLAFSSSSSSDLPFLPSSFPFPLPAISPPTRLGISGILNTPSPASIGRARASLPNALNTPGFGRVFITDNALRISSVFESPSSPRSYSARDLPFSFALGRFARGAESEGSRFRLLLLVSVSVVDNTEESTKAGGGLRGVGSSGLAGGGVGRMRDAKRGSVIAADVGDLDDNGEEVRGEEGRAP